KLSTNTAYGGRVAGTTSGGPGPLGATVTGYTLAAPATALTLTLVGVSSATLSWSANTNPPGTAFFAEAAPGGNFAADAASATTTGTGLTLAGLSPSTTYTFQVRSQNSDGVLTPAASTVSSVTLPSPPSLVPSGLAGA